MRQTPFRALAGLVLCVAVSVAIAKPILPQAHPVDGEWVGSFGCEGKLTYFRMSVGAGQVALHIHDETVVYATRSVAETSFEAELIPAEKAPNTVFPTRISAMLVIPDDLLTGTLKGLAEADAACTHFVMVRFVEWPAPASADGGPTVPTKWFAGETWPVQSIGPEAQRLRPLPDRV